MPLAHRETVDEQGVEAALLDVGRLPRRAAAARSARRPRSAGSSTARARAFTTSPTGSTTSRRRWRSSPAADVELIDSEPRIGIRSSRVAFVHPRATRLGADGDRRARGGSSLMAERDQGRDRIRDRAGALGEAQGQTSWPTCARRSRRARAGTTCAPRRAPWRSTSRPSSSSASTTPRTRSASPAEVRPRALALAGIGATLAAALWWRKNPSACPYGQRFWVEAPHPLITRARLREVLDPRPGERVLEIGPGTGYYSLDLADGSRRTGSLELFDLQQEMLDHTMRRAAERGLGNVGATRGDATALPVRRPELRRGRAHGGARRDPRPGRRR